MRIHHTATLSVVLLFCSTPGFAQSQRGQFVGLVTDPSGSVVPGAKISVSNPETGVTVETASNNTGYYAVPGLQYGRYNVTATAAGFSTYTVENVEIATATTTTLNLVLRIGNISEQVDVKAANPVVLEATTSSIGTSVDEKLKMDVPNLISGGKRSPFS